MPCYVEACCDRKQGIAGGVVMNRIHMSTKKATFPKKDCLMRMAGLEPARA